MVFVRLDFVIMTLRLEVAQWEPRKHYYQCRDDDNRVHWKDPAVDWTGSPVSWQKRPECDAHLPSGLLCKRDRDGYNRSAVHDDKSRALIRTHNGRGVRH